MRLLLDIGNSVLKWALADGPALQVRGRFVHRDTDLLACADQHWLQLQRPQAVVVANVAGPAVAARLGEWFGLHWGIEPRFLVPQAAACGVTSGYRDPGRLGIDRWAALVAARAITREAVCVIDCGTAITLDLMDSRGVHRGGLIVPGIAMMQQALRRNTAGLDVPGAGGTTVLLALNTEDAIQGGSVYAAAAAVEQIARRMVATCDGPVSILLSGGDAERIVPLLGIAAELYPELVLQGLALLAGEN